MQRQMVRDVHYEIERIRNEIKEKISKHKSNYIR
jgi:hypothetical protein